MAKGRRARRNAGEETEEKTDRQKLADVVHAATNSPHTAIDVPLLRCIKNLVRASDDNVRAALDLLMDRLKKNHAQVRYLALLLIDELFTRSKLFRALLVPRFEGFLLLSLGYRSDYALPPPSDRADLLRSKSLEFVEKWNDMFGQHYRQIRLGYDYLKNTLHLQFPNLREVASHAEQQKIERAKRTQELLQKKYTRLKEEHSDYKKDILSVLLQMEECLTILKTDQFEEGVILTSMVHQHQETLEGENNEDHLEEYGTTRLRLAMHGAESDKVPSEETEGNTAVFDTLREILKVITHKHIPVTQEWMSIIMRVDSEEREPHDLLLKEVIDIRHQLFSARSKCEKLGLKCDALDENSLGEENVDGIEWEIGGISNEGFDPFSQSTNDSLEKLEAIGVVDADCRSREATKSSRILKEKSMGSLLPDDTRQGLLKEAPVLDWGSFLDNWGRESRVPANTRGLMLENHWGKVDPDVLIPEDKLAEINMRSSYYQPRSSDIRACLAPLRRGGVCQRKDLHTCPLHGPIIPRDSSGNLIASGSQLGSASLQAEFGPSNDKPISTKSILESTVDGDSPSQDVGVHVGESSHQVVEAILEQAITNVRARDKAGKKTKIALKNRKRKDREHNEAILRAAALSRTSQGLLEVLGEDMESNDGREARGKTSRKRSGKRRGGLMALLRKKPSVKDRLARRLLTGQVTDATVAQLTRDEQSRYRESYPNQW